MAAGITCEVLEESRVVAQIELEAQEAKGSESKVAKRRKKPIKVEPKEGSNKGKYSEADDHALIRYVVEKSRRERTVQSGAFASRRSRPSRPTHPIALLQAAGKAPSKRSSSRWGAPYSGRRPRRRA